VCLEQMPTHLTPENWASYNESLPVERKEGGLNMSHQKYTDEQVMNILAIRTTGALGNKLTIVGLVQTGSPNTNHRRAHRES